MRYNPESITQLEKLGFRYQDANELRRIAMTLHRWHEMECGTDNGCVERDEKTHKTFWLNSMTMKRWPIADRETGALKRLARIMKAYPAFQAYVQGDPRGASLYIIPPGTIEEGKDLDAYYNRGIAVYK